MVNLAVSTAVSALVGYASIAFLISYLRRHSTYAFIIYRLIAERSSRWLLRCRSGTNLFVA